LGLSIKKNCRIKKDCEPLLSLTDWTRDVNNHILMAKQTIGIIHPIIVQDSRDNKLDKILK
jgi:hypothetical protein